MRLTLFEIIQDYRRTEAEYIQTKSKKSKEELHKLGNIINYCLHHISFKKL